MAYNIKDVKEVEYLSKLLEDKGFKCYMYKDNPRIGKNPGEKVKREIKKSSCVLAFCTKNGHQSAWLNQEIGFTLGQRKPIIPIAQDNKYVDGLLQGTEYYQLDIHNPSIPGFDNLLKYLKKVIK
jgi:hypothetical protein